MKTLSLVILLFISSVAFSQGSLTSLSAGTGEFFSFKQGEKSVYKTALISQVNQIISNRIIVSAITVGTVDSVAKGYIGTGLNYVVNQSRDSSQNLIVGVNFMKGEGREALIGAQATLRINNILLSGVVQRDINNRTFWIGATIQSIILGGRPNVNRNFQNF